MRSLRRGSARKGIGKHEEVRQHLARCKKRAPRIQERERLDVGTLQPKTLLPEKRRPRK